MTIPRFIHLRARSPYSMLEGALRIKDTAKRCEAFGMPALALTDTNNLCGALEFSKTLSEAGIQPIMGVTLSIDIGLDDQPGQIRREPDGTVVCLAQSERGYENIMALSSAAYLDVSATDLPHITREHLLNHTQDVIVLTGGPDGVLNRLIVQGRTTEAESWLDDLATLFPRRVYVELQRHGTSQEQEAEPHLLRWAYEKSLPLVATNEPFFLDPDMHHAHDALLAIAEGSYILEKDRRKVTAQHYFKSQDKMCELFSDIPEALTSTIDIARRCAFQAYERKPILPNFGSTGESEADLLAEVAREGLKARLKAVEPACDIAEYESRLEHELSIINKMNFPGYFLIVSDFIKWAKSQDIPVGPGRGSGAGSVVAWALQITDLDPLRYGLLFERFLNPERISMPDFDIDFCQERRGEVIRYVQDKYGYDQVAHIITFGTLQARAVVRDVGRVLQMPLGQVDRLAKLVPSNPANPVTLKEAINMEAGLQDARANEPAVRELLDIALKLEGLYRNASTHAAGVVIGDRPLTQLIPLYRDPRSDIPATQFTMKWAEAAGLVKFDFLGLKTLTVIDRVKKYLALQGEHIDLDNVSTKTPEAYHYLAQGLSAGVFQLESSGMRDTLRKMAPDSIEELTALISLYRPGPMKNIDTYIDRKYGRTKIEYPHPSLEAILQETYGIIIYQEQVMEIAKVLSGFSLGEADVLRRAMGKKDVEAMAQQKKRFVEGAQERGVDRDQADHIFELVNEFAGYGFNKSHAAAYALISFQTAYLKAFYPTEFVAAIMSLDINNIDKLSQFFQEARRMGVTVRPPCINRSGADFTVSDGAVNYALGALKNVGLEAMRHVVEVRESGGLFKDVFDFARRVDARIVNKRALENLARGGAFDALETNRAKILAGAQTLLSIGNRAYQERHSDQTSLFGGEAMSMEEPDLPNVQVWGNVEQLDNELAAIGFYFGGHPLDSMLDVLEKRKTTMSADIEDRHKGGAQALRLAGIVRKRQERLSKRNKRFAYVNLSDPSGDFEVFVGEELLGLHRERLESGALVSITAKVEERDGEIKLFATSISSLDDIQAQHVKGLQVRLRANHDDALDEVKACFDVLRDAPSKRTGYIDIIVPLTSDREALCRVEEKIPIDDKVQQALRTLKSVQAIVEVAA